MIMNFSPLREKLESLVRYVLSNFYAVLSFDSRKKKIARFAQLQHQHIIIHTLSGSTSYYSYRKGWYKTSMGLCRNVSKHFGEVGILKLSTQVHLQAHLRTYWVSLTCFSALI